MRDAGGRTRRSRVAPAHAIALHPERHCSADHPVAGAASAIAGRGASWQATAQAFTALQGQYLAFIYAYSVIHGRAPAERDLQLFFRVTPPVIHQAILHLAAKGFVSRVPGQPRSLQVLVPPEALPVLRGRGGV
jgi:hypothetical protein